MPSKVDQNEEDKKVDSKLTRLEDPTAEDTSALTDKRTEKRVIRIQ